MISINSSAKQTKVINSRAHKTRPVVWRRRQDPQTGLIFTTYERPSLAENKKITLPDGSTDIFNLGKLLISISRAFTHNTKSAQYDSMQIAETIEDYLSISPLELTPSLIAHTAHDVLRRFDNLAAVQYAARHHLIDSTRRRGRPSFS